MVSEPLSKANARTWAGFNSGTEVCEKQDALLVNKTNNIEQYDMSSLHFIKTANPLMTLPRSAGFRIYLNKPTSSVIRIPTFRKNSHTKLRF